MKYVKILAFVTHSLSLFVFLTTSLILNLPEKNTSFYFLLGVFIISFLITSLSCLALFNPELIKTARELEEEKSTYFKLNLELKRKIAKL